MAFGPDGALYISIGDGISFNFADPRNSVQNLDSLSGKILRVDPMTGLGLPDNPFVQPGDFLDGVLNENHSRVYQLGLRNPFSMGFDQDGQLFIANTGWNSLEEIETGSPGANFGWPYYEGGDNGVLVKTPGYQNLSTATAFYAAVDNGTIEITPAYRAFAHDSAAPGFRNQAITGGDVIYTGTRYPTEFLNDFFFTNFIDGQVFVIDVNDSREVKFLYETQGVPVHFSQGPDGYVYYADLTQGIIGRLLIEPFQSGPGIVKAINAGGGAVTVGGISYEADTSWRRIRWRRDRATPPSAMPSPSPARTTTCSTRASVAAIHSATTSASPTANTCSNWILPRFTWGVTGGEPAALVPACSMSRSKASR